MSVSGRIAEARCVRRQELHAPQAGHTGFPLLPLFSLPSDLYVYTSVYVLACTFISLHVYTLVRLMVRHATVLCCVLCGIRYSVECLVSCGGSLFGSCILLYSVGW